jgi:hypothetical protein
LKSGNVITFGIKDTGAIVHPENPRFSALKFEETVHFAGAVRGAFRLEDTGG